MGSCLGANRSRDQQRYGSSSYPAMGKNQPLKKEHPKWKSDVPLTSGQLLSKREEFWDTAPVFEGQKEIWDALKAAASALESGDCSLAQAIIDGANIVLPHGTLLDCYDELGAHYQVPVYCLSHPVNLVQDGTVKRQQSFEEPKEINEDDQSALQVRIRLSTEKEVILKVLPSDAISAAKKRLEQQDEELPVSRQRWFFSGKMLTDPMRIEDCHLKKGFVILCIMREEPKESS